MTSKKTLTAELFLYRSVQSSSFVFPLLFALSMLNSFRDGEVLAVGVIRCDKNVDSQCMLTRVVLSTFAAVGYRVNDWCRRDVVVVVFLENGT